MSNQESKFDFLATGQQLGKIDRGTTKNKNRPHQLTIKFIGFLPFNFLPLQAPPWPWPLQFFSNGALVLTCNGASSGSGMNGGSGATLAKGVFNTYSCGGGGGMNIDGGGGLGSGGSGSTSVFNGTSSAAWEAGNSGNGGLNNLGQGSLSSGSGSGGAGGGPTPGLNGCGGNGGSGAGNGPYSGQAGGGGYIKFTMY